MRRLASALLALPMILLAPTAIAGETFRDSTWHWSATLPEGWQSVSTDAITELLGGGGNVDFRAAFVGTPDGRVGHPFVGVQFISVSLEEKTFEEILWQFDTEALADLPPGQRESLVELARRAQAAGKKVVCLDPYRARLVTWNQRDFPIVGACQGLAVSYFVRDGLIQLNFWDRDADYEKHLPEFGEIVRSFEFEEGREWFRAREYAARTIEEEDGGIPIVLLVGGGAGIAALLVGLLVLANRRPRATRSRGGRRPPRSGRARRGGRRGRGRS